MAITPSEVTNRIMPASATLIAPELEEFRQDTEHLRISAKLITHFGPR